MLSAEDNKLYTQVGPGTPMGELLRRYWQPVGMTGHVTSKPQRIKILGEELLLYRGESGQTALTQLRCAHRSLALDYGRVEGDNIRCPYHGWLYDAKGKCLAQPAEPEGSAFKDKVQLKAYPTQEASGLVFAYMGPGEAPLLPLYDVMLEDKGKKSIGMRNVSANWLNAIENIVDISHLAWLHAYTFPAYGAKKVSYHWDCKDYGLDNVMDVEGIDDTHISCYAFPNINRFSAPPAEKGGELIRSMIFRVPMDDENTMQFYLRWFPDPETTINYQRREEKLGVYRELKDSWWGIDVGDEDRMAIEQQGRIADRPNEHLGVSDGGIIAQRKMLRESLDLIAAGKDPLCLIRDPAKQKIFFPQKSTAMSQRQDHLNYGRAFTQAAAE